MKKLLFLFVVFFFSSIHNLDAQESEQPIKCNVGIYVKTLRIHQADEMFESLFYWWMRVDSIESNLSKAELKEKYEFISDCEFVNGEGDVEIDTYTIDTIHHYYYVAGRCKLQIPYKADYRKFPFDIQNLDISIENKVFNKDVIVYVPDTKTTYINTIEGKSIEILNGDQYNISKMESKLGNYIYKTNFGDPGIEGEDEYSRISFEISISRNPTGMMQKISLPLLVVLILSYLVFFIPDDEIGTASGLTVTALLAAIAFQWTLNDSLPKVSYLTLIDKIFYLVYAFIFYAMAQTVVTYNLGRTDSPVLQKISHATEKHSRYLFPLVFLILFILLLMFP
jgi:hypothetical protein